MIAIAGDGTVRWQAETAPDFPIVAVRSGSVRGADASIPLSEVTLDIVYDPESGWPTQVRVFSFPDGEATVLGDQLGLSGQARLSYHGRTSAGFSGPVTDGEGAAESGELEPEDAQCALALFDGSGEEFAALTHSCAVLHRGSPVGGHRVGLVGGGQESRAALVLRQPQPQVHKLGVEEVARGLKLDLDGGDVLLPRHDGLLFVPTFTTTL